MDNSIYEVTRDDYKGFVNQIKPECRDVRIEEIGDIHIAAKIYSKKTGKCLCSNMIIAYFYYFSFAAIRFNLFYEPNIV